jgi:hypothetical protein
MIRTLTPHELLTATCSALGVTGDCTPHGLIKPALRRGAFHLAPASRAELVRFASDPLKPLGVERDAVEEALDELIVYGDILEMRRMYSDPWDAPSSVLRPAPPSFVAREDGIVVILGVAGDLATALTPDLEERVAVGGPVRTVLANADEQLPARLRGLGLTQLSENAWLRAPSAETAGMHVDRWRARLASVVPTPGGVANLEILDPSRKIRFYKGRWTAPSRETDGLRLARRPQDYGAPLWTIAEFQNGIACKVVDLYEDDDRQLPHDLGWRFQAALDAMLGHPQEVGVRSVGNRVALDFFSPLPGFAERRLALVGTKTTEPGRIFSFDMTEQAARIELLALQQTMWMHPLREEDAR